MPNFGSRVWHGMECRWLISDSWFSHYPKIAIRGMLFFCMRRNGVLMRLYTVCRKMCGCPPESMNSMSITVRSKCSIVTKTFPDVMAITIATILHHSRKLVVQRSHPFLGLALSAWLHPEISLLRCNPVEKHAGTSTHYGSFWTCI